jgi:glycosyltransferase involved in cell wall biosynthesis
MNELSQPLRVAVIASSLKLAGAEKQTFYMARALHRAGIEVRFYHLDDEGHYEPVLRQSGVDVCRIYSPNRSWLMLCRLTASLLKFRPQIVLAAQFGDLLFAAPAGRICKALVLGGVRSDGFYELNQHGRWSRWMVRLAHGLIANSYRARHNLVSQHIRRQKIEVLPNVIDLVDFDRRSKLPLDIPLPSERIIAVAVGNLHAYKRFDRFIEAVALARRDEPALAGVIAGADCGAKADLQARAKTLGLASGDLIFLGKCDRIPALLARSAMLVLTSDFEGFPNVILEAMAARLPVISVPAGDAGMIVRPGKTGEIVEAKNIRGIAAHMVQLAQQPALRKALGENGRKGVEEDYNCEPLAGRLMATFRHFAERNGRSWLGKLLESALARKNFKMVPDAAVFQRGNRLVSGAEPMGKPFTTNP